MYVAQKWIRFWGNDMHQNKKPKARRDAI
ncbi:hypothetical protein EN943_08130 [Mesorhizobium sp. M7A.F.Ca.US.006.01.1.1]|nr:hypothetical protein EN943_08130 [Mesorhizobium sp. M7A.F.Ca.US.006.01.1.1]